MKKEFFHSLESILFNTNLDSKFNEFNNFFDDFNAGLVYFNNEYELKNSFSCFTPSKVLHATRINRPKCLTSNNKLAAFLHSIAHIEFCAINLALDSLYRFKNMPLNFYKDWLEVAKEEFYHFYLLESSLNELGFKYGDFSVHLNLYDAMQKTHNSLALRMGVVHRGLEARGLDSNPFVVSKILSSNLTNKTQLKEIFEVILNDEIKHVKKGSTWWKYSLDSPKTKQELLNILDSSNEKEINKDNLELAFTTNKIDSETLFIGLCETFSEFNLAGKVLNKQARLDSGFSQFELEKLSQIYG